MRQKFDFYSLIEWTQANMQSENAEREGEKSFSTATCTLSQNERSDRAKCVCVCFNATKRGIMINWRLVSR